MIRTERLRLIAGTVEHFEAMQDGDAALGRLLGLDVAEGWEGLPDHREKIAVGGAEFLRANPSALGWWMYLFVHDEERKLVGVGGLKGEPQEGAVELGYGLAPDYRRRGLATEAAKGLLSFALADPRVRRVIAHTLPERNESTRVLERLGMRFEEAIVDPEDGQVWRWAVERPT